MKRTKVKTLATASLLVGFLIIRPQACHCWGQHPPTSPRSGERGAPPSPPGRGGEGLGVDRYGDSLPAGAIARLGTVRLRHGHNVMALVFSPDGKSLASAGHDHSIRLWDAASGKEQRQFGDPQVRADAYSPLRWAFCVAFSPDGKTLASGDFAAGWPVKSIHLWDATTGKERLTLNGHQQGILSVAFSPDGKTLASASADQTIRLWDTSALVPQADGSIRAGKELRQITGHQQVVNCVVFSPDGKLLASAGADQTVRLWDPETGKERRVIEKQLGGVESIAFSPDGKVLASVGADKTVRFWDPSTGKETRSFKGSEGLVTCIAFSGDGKKLACGGTGARVYNLAAEVNPEFGFTAGAIRFVALSGHGNTLATAADNDNMIHLWDVTTAKKIGPSEAHESWVGYLAFSPDGKTITSAARDGTVRRWEAATGKELHRIQHNQAKSREAALSPDSKILAAGNANGTILLREADSGKEIGKLPGIKSAVQCVTFSADGKRIAAGGADKKIHIWDLAANKQVQEFGEHSAGVTRVAFSPDGKTVASAGGDPVIHVWELTNQVRLTELAEHQGTADSIAFSPDGKLLATGSHQDGSARIWDPAGGNLLRHIPGHPGYVQAVLFSPDGRTLAVGSWRSIRLYEVATGLERGRLLGHEGDVAAFAFSPDGRRLASSGGDTTALVWDLAGQAATDVSPELLAKAWTDLGGDDGSKAYRAVWTLVAAPAEAVAFLQKQLQPQAPADPKRIAKWIADLDDDEFTVRTKATAELEKLGDLAEPALRKALEDMPSPEVSQHVNQLLAKLHGQATSGTWVQKLRAVEVLEHIGTAEAKQVLEIVQKGSPEARLTQEAKAALGRLTDRK